MICVLQELLAQQWQSLVLARVRACVHQGHDASTLPAVQPLLGAIGEGGTVVRKYVAQALDGCMAAIRKEARVTMEGLQKLGTGESHVVLVLENMLVQGHKAVAGR